MLITTTLNPNSIDSEYLLSINEIADGQVKTAYWKKINVHHLVLHVIALRNRLVRYPEKQRAKGNRILSGM